MPSDKERILIKSASYLSVTLSIILILAKTFGYAATDSQSMLASLIDSLLDASYSTLNVVLLYFALSPPDHNHRFGHDKIQDIAVFLQALFFLGTSLVVIYSSVCSLFEKSSSDKPHIDNNEIGLYVMYLCIALTFVLVAYQSYVVKKTRSGIVDADKTHYLSDLLTNLAVVASLKMNESLWWFDSASGIAIGLYICFMAYRLLIRALKNLMDEEFSEEDKRKIKSIIAKYREVEGLHELKTRYAGNKPFIQFHIEMDGNMSLKLAHSVSENIEKEILKKFPGGEVIIHQDPLDSGEEKNYREKIRI